MENNYWIIDDWLIFKPGFNDKLTDYYDIINKYKKIMFSNYNDRYTNLIVIYINNRVFLLSLLNVDQTTMTKSQRG
jgi:hypothetical protein